MNSMPNRVAVLDACVLYPAPVRDFLLSIADIGLYEPKWTSEIQDEWSRNLLVNRPDLNKNQLDMTIKAMNIAFPFANVENYSSFISGITLPDPNDRHVVAAAIQSKADMIITYNIKDFPTSVLENYSIEIKHPDVFFTYLFDLQPEKVTEAFRKMVKRLKNPKKTIIEVLATLEKSNLSEITEKLKHLRQLCVVYYLAYYYDPVLQMAI